MKSYTYRGEHFELTKENDHMRVHLGKRSATISSHYAGSGFEILTINNFRSESSTLESAIDLACMQLLHEERESIKKQEKLKERNEKEIQHTQEIADFFSDSE